MNTNLFNTRWCENVIIADGDYIDAVAFNLIVNFERMIGRRIPKADMARWIDCVALDNLGEFLISSLPAVKPTGGGNLFTEAASLACSAPEVKRVMLIPNAELVYDDLRRALSRADDEQKRITVFAMQPMPGGNFRQEILGYSLMSALGIRAEEIKHD